MRKTLDGHGIICFLLFMIACTNKTPLAEAPVETVQTPVTITGILHDPLQEFIELNATSTFLLKNYIKANANGYLESAHVLPGQFVKAGQILFTIKTKEAVSIGNAVNRLDTSFKFSGTNAIKAGAGGFISQLNHQSGDYVQDGEQLAVISDVNSFVFLMELPFELRPFIKVGDHVVVQLPDEEKFPGIISSLMPTMDAPSQTQNIVIKVNPGHTIPENLVAKVKVLKIARIHSVSLARAAILSDETQSNFWVMKMIDSVTAVRVPVKKGIETKDRVEILSPVFTDQDKIILTGNYGLTDTARVIIVSH
jgi:HlyD family secretion protein